MSGIGSAKPTPEAGGYIVPSKTIDDRLLEIADDVQLEYEVN